MRTRVACTFEDCPRTIRKDKLCAAHLRQRDRGGQLTPITPPSSEHFDGALHCGKCELWRDPDEFPPDAVRGGKQRTCDLCRAAYMRDYNAANAERIRLQVTLRKWGISEEAWRALLEYQDNRCAICRAERRAYRELSLDHSHDNGEWRGMLCQDCNMGLGQFGDDPARLRAAADYIECGGTIGAMGRAVM